MSYSDSAYIYLRKKILDWQWYSDTPTRSVFIHCLLRASWKETEFKGVKFGRGQLIDSNETIAKDLGLSIQNVKTAINHLKDSGDLTSLKIGRTRIITVVKYDLYQQTNQLPNLELTLNQPETNLKLTSIKEVNKEKEVKEVNKELSYDNSSLKSSGNEESKKPYQEYIDRWNELKDFGIQPIRSISGKRQISFRARIKEHGKDSFAECIERIKESEFLQKNSFFNFDWMICETNYPKVLEGKYGEKSQKKQNDFTLDDVLKELGKDGE